jgi:hypothetical protein
MEDKPEGCQTFYEWLNANYNNFEDKLILNLMKDAWNAGVSNACSWFGSMEGVDYGAEEGLREK